MAAKLTPSWVRAQELFHPHHQLWVGFWKHPFKPPIFWGRFLENSSSHCPSQGSSWRIHANPALAAPPCSDKSWGVSKPWELLTWQIYECFLSQEMFAGWDSPELGFPLFIFPSDLLIRADNGNSTVFPSPATKIKGKIQWTRKKIGAGGARFALRMWGKVGSASVFRKLLSKLVKTCWSGY